MMREFSLFPSIHSLVEESHIEHVLIKEEEEVSKNEAPIKHLEHVLVKYEQDDGKYEPSIVQESLLMDETQPEVKASWSTCFCACSDLACR